MISSQKENIGEHKMKTKFQDFGTLIGPDPKHTHIWEGTEVQRLTDGTPYIRQRCIKCDASKMLSNIRTVYVNMQGNGGISRRIPTKKDLTLFASLIS